VWGAKGICNKGLGREIREKAKGLLWAYKKHQRCIFNEHMLVEVQTYKNRLTNLFVSLFLYVWAFSLSAKKCIEHPIPSRVSAALPVKKSNHGRNHQHHQAPLTPLTGSLCSYSPVALPVKKSNHGLLAIRFVMLKSLTCCIGQGHEFAINTNFWYTFVIMYDIQIKFFLESYIRN